MSQQSNTPLFRGDAEALSVRAGELYEGYVGWCAAGGLRAHSNVRLARELAERGVTKERKRNGVEYQGIALKAGPV